MDGTTIIGIDTGNRCIKTANNLFIAGIMTVEAETAFQQDALTYEGMLYMLTNKRSNYLVDKTETEDYFHMALFAIAMELETRGLNETAQCLPITLAMGLPPRDYARLKERYRKYFLRGKVEFTYHKRKYVIDIQEVMVFPQGFAGIYADFGKIKEYDKAYIVDIGGYTTDVIEIRRGKVDPEFCTSFNHGMITLYNDIKRAVETEMGYRFDECQIDETIRSGICPIDDNRTVSIIQKKTREFAENVLRELYENGIDLRVCKGIFVGGGAIRLRNYLHESKYTNAPYFVPDIHANACGYEAFAKKMRR